MTESLGSPLQKTEGNKAHTYSGTPLPKVFENAFTKRLGAGAYLKPHRPAAHLVLDGTASPHGHFNLDDFGILGSPLDSAGLSAVAQYPDTSALEAKIATYFGVGAQRVFVTAGADEAIDRLCRCYLTPWEGTASAGSLLVTKPTFEMFKRYASLAGGLVSEVDWGPGEAFPVAEFLSRITPQTRMCALVTPNNPTGTVVGETQLRDLFENTKGVIVLLDLAYVDFADFDPTHMALEYEHVIVMRSFSKGWGLPGLRLGYVMGHPRALDILRLAGGPYTVSRASLAVAESLFPAQQQIFLDQVTEVVRERSVLEQRLKQWGLRVFPSGANYVFAQVCPQQGAPLRGVQSAQDAQLALAERGILVRHFPNRPEVSNGLRITLPGHKSAFNNLCQALQEVFSP